MDKMDLQGFTKFIKLQRFEADTDVYDMTASAIKNKVTDIIEMTTDDIRRLCEMTLGIEEGREYQIPSDIIFANTFPLRDFKFIHKFDKESYFETVEYQFNIFDLYPTIRTNDITHDLNTPLDAFFAKAYPDKLRDYYASEKDHFHLMSSSFAAMTLRPIWKRRPDIETSIVLPLSCDATSIFPPTSIFSWVANGKDALKTITDQYYRIHLKRETEDEIFNLAFTGAVLFYAISCALLNPIIRVIFDKKSNKRPIETGKALGKNKRAKLRYVKYHRINFDDIDKAFEEKGFVRKTMVWYVTGHWREYSSGKRIFIQGYWKGPLRNSKTTIESISPREREIET